MRTIIIEDELASQEALRNYLESYCLDIDVLGVAGTLEDGRDLISRIKPELVFLDIEMPFGTGFDLLESLSDISFHIIFVTAYNHYAIQAIQHSASNYLLKPINIQELIDAVDKVKKEHKQSVNFTNILLENIQVTQRQKTKIVLPVLDGFEIVRAEEIVCCEANDNFTRFILESEEKHLICRTLKHYQEILEPMGFLRIHKSYLINLEFVTKYSKGKGGMVTMSSGLNLPVSPNKKNELLSHLNY